jgi:cathepsin L
LLANPASVDWAAAGAVTTPVTQGSCGACYAFASSSAIESFIKIKKNGALTSLSPQHIVDCSYGQGGNSGCVGGHPSSSYAFVAANGGIASAADYPYRTAVGGCALAKGTKIAATISGYETVPTGTNADSGLESAVAGQPVSVAVCATGPAWQFYKSGVITSACPAAVNHGVLVVGYGTATDGKTGYWKIKNSWGNTWGEEGYLRIARGTAYNGVSGQCGVYTDMTYPK